MKVVIVGGVAGGATAAARIRRLDEEAEIVVFERSSYVSYANCGLPYYIGDVITDEGDLTLQTPESFWNRFGVKVMVNHQVIKINTDEKTVTVRDLVTGEEWIESYDKLLLSPGAKPIIPCIPGADNDKIFTLRTVEDTFKIHEYVRDNEVRSVLIVGGGFIGSEMAENLKERGMDVTIIQRSSQLLGILDYDMAAFVHNKFRSKGVSVILNSNVSEFRDSKDHKAGIVTILEDGKAIISDMVLMAIGVEPENNLAKEAGLELGIKGSIVVNDKMETSVKDIYAVGDAVQVKQYITGHNVVIPLAGPANKQGRIAADNICGGNSRYNGSMGTSVIKIFDLTVATTGLTEKALKCLDINCDSVVLSPLSHAGYYPGAKVMTMKVIFEKKTLRILGAQIIGTEGVDKRIDVIATAIQCGMKGDKLKDLELAYAPPYSSAKDPVNMAGFIIENINKGLVKQYYWNDIIDLPRDGSVTLLDTRTIKEYNNGHIDGYINIPVDNLRERLNEIDKYKPVYVICQSGVRSYIACRILTQKGYNCYNFSGGYRFYATVIKEVEMSDSAYTCGKEK